MLQLPVLRSVKAPPLVMVHTPVLAEVKAGLRPEVAVALKVGLLPKFCVPGLLKTML